MSVQLEFGSAGTSSSTASSASGSLAAESSASPSPSASSSSESQSGSYDCGEKDVEWSQKSCRRPRGRRGQRRRAPQRTAREPCRIQKKKLKNAREKKRVLFLRRRYGDLSKVLGDYIERGSGHFSKVRVLAAAFKKITELLETLQTLSTQSSSHIDEASVEYEAIESPSIDLDLNLNCEERLDPVVLEDYHSARNTGSDTFDLLDLHTCPDMSATPYFTYSSPDFPSVIGDSSMMFPLPPSSLISPDLSTHSSLSPLGLSPPPPPPPPAQHSYHCGDVWLAIGCN